MKKKPNYHLDSFVKEVQSNITKFAEEYRKKHAENPEHYPLELTEDNYGLWLEFFVFYYTDGRV